MRVRGLVCILGALLLWTGGGLRAQSTDGELDALSTEYAQLSAIYQDLLRDPPTYEKTQIQAIVAAVTGLLPPMSITSTHKGVPYRVHGARMALRISSVIAHRHSYCQDARDVALAARQAFVDWATADATKADMVTALTGTLDTQAVSLQEQEDGVFPPPPPPPAEPGEPVHYDVQVVGILGVWGITIQGNPSEPPQTFEDIPAGFAHPIDLEDASLPITVTVWCIAGDGAGEDANIQLQLIGMDGVVLAENSAGYMVTSPTVMFEGTFGGVTY